LDILKSGMQKYLRRKEFGKMAWCVMEIFKFELWASDEKESKMSKGIITNLLNRLIIMMDEELLFCEVERYLILRKLIEKFEENRKDGGKYLLLICKYLTEGRLLRRNSDIRAYWDYRFRFEYVEDVEEMTDEKYFKKFVDCFKRKDDECFRWMFKIFNGGVRGKNVRFRRKENVYMIWEYLFGRKVVIENKYYKKLIEYKLKEFFKLDRKERFMFLASCIDLVMKCDGKEKKVNIEDELRKIEFREIDELLENCNVKLEIDTYAYDMHTSVGRNLGKSKKDFAIEGCYVRDEDTEFLVKEWRDFYIYEKVKGRKFEEKIEEKIEEVVEKKVEEKIEEKVENKVEEVVEKKVEEVVQKVSRDKLRNDKTRRIKKMRGNPNFKELEKNLEIVKDVDAGKIKLCSDITCGGKVMCFEYKGKIWKEGRKSMFYNRDYCVLDDCKELFGLEKIGMKRVLSDFRIEKKDKSEKSWNNNWEKVFIKKGEEPVIYCIMDKVNPGEEIGKNKNLFKTRKFLKEYIKIGVFRGIFRVSDFNKRNVLVKVEKDEKKLVSIDEGDIGKRLDILGIKESGLIKELNKDKTIISEIMNEIEEVGCDFCIEKMREYKFNEHMVKEIINNFKNLREDLVKEGVCF
jgi:hypothetical protein